MASGGSRPQKLEHSDYGDLNERSECIVLRTERQEKASDPKHPWVQTKALPPPPTQTPNKLIRNSPRKAFYF